MRNMQISLFGKMEEIYLIQPIQLAVKYIGDENLTLDVDIHRIGGANVDQIRKIFRSSYKGNLLIQVNGFNHFADDSSQVKTMAIDLIRGHVCIIPTRIIIWDTELKDKIFYWEEVDLNYIEMLQKYMENMMQ